ncbi:MAG: hypothetical protein IKR18_04505, partial [Bacteroidaceae bacterium]|nr:hypothetical protein [Bacteroidaceae bacterium]
DNNNVITKCDFTSGTYKGYYCFTRDISAQELLKSDNLETFVKSASFYNKETNAYVKNDEGSLYNPTTKKYEVLIEPVKSRIEKEQREQREEQKKRQQLQAAYQKYGKKYVDAIYDGKILIGTPEALIKSLRSSYLISESQTSRTYEIKNIWGTRFAKVYVNKKTRRVYSVTY